MSKITILPYDRLVIKDGNAVMIDMAGIPSNIRAIHFDDSIEEGEIEYYDKPEVQIESIDFYQPLIDRYNSAIAVAIAKDSDPYYGMSEDQKLNAILKAKIVELTKSYELAISEKISFTTEAGVTKEFQTDAASRKNLHDQMAAYQIVGHVPVGFYWLSADNTKVVFTLADMENVWAMANTAGFMVFDHLQTKKEAVRAATSFSAIQAISW